MSDNNLKNRMDDLHQDFDKEALWSTIESKKRKGKPDFWRVMGIGAFAVIAGITFYTIYDANNTPIPNQKNIVATQNHQISAEDSSAQVRSTSLETSNELEQASIMTENQNTNTIAESHPQTNVTLQSEIHSNIATITKNKTSEQKTFVSKHYAEKNSNLTKAIKNVQQQSINKDIKVINDHEIHATVTNQQTGATNLNDHQKVDENAVTETINNNEYTEANMLALLPNINIHYLIIPSRNFTLPSVTLISKPEPIQTKNNILSVTIGIGIDRHRFSNTPLGEYRQSMENTLESRSLGIQYERKIHSFSLLANLIAAQSETVLNHSTRYNTWQLVQDGNVINGWNGYQYKLYNQYQRLDADMQLLYHIGIGNNWLLSPSLGLGFNILNKQQGQFFDVEGNLLELSERPEYKSNSRIYVVYGFKLRRYIQKDFIIDLHLFAQSKRKLTDPNYQGYEQSIRPLGISFGFGKVF